MGSNIIPYFICPICVISRYIAALNWKIGKDRDGFLAVIPVPGGQGKVQWVAKPVSHRMDLCGLPAPAGPYLLVVFPVKSVFLPLQRAGAL